jgi:hypothetical protein
MYLLRKNRFSIVCISILSLNLFFSKFNFCFGQDDLLKVLQTATPAKNEKVIATFKANKIINIETNETVRKKNLDVRISHLFGNMGAESGGGIHNFYGLDQSADIRIGFHYGLTDKLMLGVSRVKRNENFEGLVKYRVLEQTSDKKVPLSMTLYGNMTYSIKESELIVKDVYRISYCAQAIFAYKLSSDFSLALTPGFLHRNFVEAGDENNTSSISGGFRYKFTRSASIIADYSHTFGRKDLPQDFVNVLGAGVEIETGGHVFTVMFTNASGILENDYLVNTMDKWTEGGFKFSFHISRMFSMMKSPQNN